MKDEKANAMSLRDTIRHEHSRSIYVHLRAFTAVFWSAGRFAGERQTDTAAPGVECRHVAEGVFPGHAGGGSLAVRKMAGDGVHLDRVQRRASVYDELFRRGARFLNQDLAA